MHAGRLDFVHKNFEFRTMPLAELVGRCESAEEFPPLISPGERCACISCTDITHQAYMHDHAWHLPADFFLPFLYMSDITEEFILMHALLQTASAPQYSIGGALQSSTDSRACDFVL